MPMKKLIAGALLVLLVVLTLLIAPHWHRERSMEEVSALLWGPGSQWLDLDGYRVHYRDEGSGTAPGDSASGQQAVLLLLHGTGSNLLTWQEWADTLRGRYRILRVDLPGFGLSGPSPERQYDMQAYSRFLDRFLDALGVDSCAVAGNSLGGAIAWHYALDRPDRVRRLVLIDAAGYPRQDKPSLAFRLASAPGLSLLMERVTPRFLVRKSLLEVYAEPELVTDSLVNLYFISLLREGNRRAFRDRAGTPPSDRSTELKTLNTPSLVLWGSEDRWIPLSDGQRLVRDLPDAELMVYPGVGHLPQEEIPWTSARTVEGWLCASGW
jgi:pimeloyl-ACP methyl ester carboxylesterase